MTPANHYAGPVVDAHFHLYQYAAENYPWLADGGLETLRRNHLPPEFKKLADRCKITASVHIEAGRNPIDPAAESRWLASLDLPQGVADRWVAHVPLAEPRAPKILTEQAAFERVVGIRDILTWHPDPALSRVPGECRTKQPIWRQNFSRLADLGLSFDLLMSPWQAKDIYELAMENPTTMIAINHCGSPIDRDAEGMVRWHKGLVLLASAPNTVLKISDPVAYDPEWTRQSLIDVIHICIDTFGPTGAMFASDYPVSGLHIGYEEWLDVFCDAIGSLSAEDQEQIFSRTATTFYKL
jgi:predicted TIM-barrel fold metal-dependent hydrolase